MAGEARIEFTGNLGKDPELKFMADGTAVLNMSVAVTEKKKEGSEWVDGNTSWYRVSLWRDKAEAAAEVLSKGSRVVVAGRLKMVELEKDGEKRTIPQVEADAFGVVPKAPAKPARRANESEESPW